ncbi:MAG: hypothetical protein JSS31_15550 [Proteobacteria bacterium]|nr:hypothetical protein [Pseudomonadota bacterium]
MDTHTPPKTAFLVGTSASQKCTVTPSVREKDKKALQQEDTGVGNAAEDSFLRGVCILNPEKMSSQAKVMCRTDPAYLTMYLDMQAKLVSGNTCNSFKTSALPHLKPLAEWFNKRKERARDTAQWGDPSPEFMVWPGICYHMGPNPNPGKLSIDRIDPTKPYVAGNLRWADKATQAANQRRNRKSVWNDIAITDAQLSAELAKLEVLNQHGQPYSPTPIKQMRYRIKNATDKDGMPRFPTPEAIHAELLKRLKVPAITLKSGDPIKDEPLMDGLGLDWEREKQAKPWLSNITFQIDFTKSLAEEIETELTYFYSVDPKNPVVPGLELRFTKTQEFLLMLKNRLQQLHFKKAESLNRKINPYDTGKPQTPAGFNAPAPITPTKPKFEATLHKPAVQSEEDEEDAKPFFLSGEALAQHLKGEHQLNG